LQVTSELAQASKQHPENQKDEIIRYAENNKIKVDKWVVPGRMIRPGFLSRTRQSEDGAAFPSS
jgi:hypothetical protein